MNVETAVNAILEGQDITQSIIGITNLKESDEPVYYEIVYGYQLAIVKVDYPTTDYGALVDILIDGLENDKVGDPYLLDLDKAEQEYNEDEYVVGGNHGLALIHNGNFNIEPISYEKVQELQAEMPKSVKIYEED